MNFLLHTILLIRYFIVALDMRLLQVKCHRYYPDSLMSNKALEYEDVGLSVTLMSIDKAESHIVRQILITNLKVGCHNLASTATSYYRNPSP